LSAEKLESSPAFARSVVDTVILAFGGPSAIWLVALVHEPAGVRSSTVNCMRSMFPLFATGLSTVINDHERLGRSHDASLCQSAFVIRSEGLASRNDHCRSCALLYSEDPPSEKGAASIARSALAMFAPPICRRNRRNAASRADSPTRSFRRIRRRRRLRAKIAASGASH
jgi:hypothetical protein